MTDTGTVTFEQRLVATGLRVGEEDREKLRAMVEEIDRAAARVRAERPYSEEPMSGFRLPAVRQA